MTFYFLYFQSVYKQFSDGLTNLAVSRETVKIVQLPNITICSGLNHALIEEYEITTLYFSIPNPKANVPKQFSKSITIDHDGNYMQQELFVLQVKNHEIVIFFFISAIT